MKKTIAFALSLILLMLTFSACSDGNGEEGALPEPVIGDHSKSEVENFPLHNCSFGAELMESLYLEHENLLISPLSIYLALGMTAEGARGQTKTEMEELLGMRTDDLNVAVAQYLRSKDSGDDGAEDGVGIANALFLRENLTKIVPVEEYSEIVTKNYCAKIFSEKFGSSVLTKINDFVRENTKGRIKKMLENGDPNAAVYIINAISFDGKWNEIYDENSVRDGIFTDSKGLEQKVKFMSCEESEYIELESACGFKKPYEDGRYAFMLLLPNDGVTVFDLLESLDGETLHRACLSSTDARVITKMPKFSASDDLELSQVLKSMGMVTAFGSNADFSGLTESTDIAIGRVLHKSFIKVDEAGTEAGAATVVEMKDGVVIDELEPKTVIANRPFVYAIVDVEEGLPIFLGVVNHVE